MSFYDTWHIVKCKQTVESWSVLKLQDVFNYRDEVINEYQFFSRNFTNISAPDIKAVVDAEYGTLESACRLIFQVDKDENGANGKTMTLYFHQQQAFAFAALKQSYVVTSGLPKRNLPRPQRQRNLKIRRIPYTKISFGSMG